MSQKRQAARHGGVRAPEESFSFEEVEDDVSGVAETSTPGGAEPSGRWAKLAAALRLGIGLLLVIGTSVSVAYSVRHYALTSPRFSIQEVNLVGGKRVAPDQAQLQAGVVLGSNVFALDTAMAERKLLENPWISEARVTRDLPRSL